MRKIAVLFLVVAVVGCAARSERTTRMDKTKKGAAIGGAAGAVLTYVLGEHEADEILAGAAIGAGIGAGVGAYMDRQEEKIARIPGTSVERISDDMLLVHFDSDLLFEVNRYDLSSDARSSLDRAAEVMAEFDKTAVIVQGHTDSSGGEDLNQTLSERRADRVVGYLAERGVDPQRMVATGYGESRPIASNDTTSGKAQNRRVDLLLKAKAK